MAMISARRRLSVTSAPAHASSRSLSTLSPPVDFFANRISFVWSLRSANAR